MTGSFLERIAAGDKSAVTPFMERYGRLVWYLCRKQSPSPADAEDAAQEIFIDLWRSAAKYNPKIASESSFVTMVARRRLIDRRRKSGKNPSYAEVPIDGIPAANMDARTNSDEVEIIRKCMSSLSPEQRTVLELSIDRGLTHTDIAAETQMPLGTVKSHARRGLLRIREMLGMSSEALSEKGGVR